jgi:predicted alpha/beta superfamily hydrolase
MIASDDSPLPGTEVHHLRSENVRDEFKILVGHCRQTDAGPPLVVLVSDANILFGTAVETARLLHWEGFLPPLLIVGVGYRVTSIEQAVALRSRDLPAGAVQRVGSGGPVRADGATRFLAFIRDELKPWVCRQYAVDPGDWAFFGDSLGGLFALYVLFSEPSTFRRYGIGSPALWWDNDVIFEHEAEYARAHDDLRARVFFSVGAYENPDGRKRLRAWRWAREGARSDEEGARSESDMVADTERMVALLRGRAYPGLEIDWQVLSGEFHSTAYPLNLSRSLRYMFDAP